MAVRLLDLWKHWPIQILVLLSLALQVVLVLLAGSRRHEAAVPMFLLWLAYQMADSTAIYAMGHLSLSDAPHEHRLLAFWAPFLVLHLGGADTISAYALQDNQLWLRHLLTLMMQILGAASVLFKHISGSDTFLWLAAILIFTVGILKYAERTWALQCGNFDSIRNSLKKEPPRKHHHFHQPGQVLGEKVADQDEIYLRRAHSLFHICKHAVVDSFYEKNPQDIEMLKALRNGNYEDMWTLMEMQLSLMYDILYTKAAVIHFWSGYCIRFISPLAIAASILLFQLSRKDGHRRVDVAITYTLLAGAFILETESLLSALGSTWTYAYLCSTRWIWLRYVVLCSGRWDQLRCFIKKMKRSDGSNRSARRWSGKMGQHNMLHVCSRLGWAWNPLIRTMARILGSEEWWIRYHYSWDTEISGVLKQWLFKNIQQLTWGRGGLNTQGLITRKLGHVALAQMDSSDRRKVERFFGVEFQEKIIILHIVTEVLLSQTRKKQDAGDEEDQVKLIRTLSNYMIFLLVERPYMLPGLSQMMLYRQVCNDLADRWQEYSYNPTPNKDIYTFVTEIFTLHDDPEVARIRSHELATILNEAPIDHGLRCLETAVYLAHLLQEGLAKERGWAKGRMIALDVLRDLWMDFLVYTANRCSRESHAKKLSSGGELVTVLWLMIECNHLE